MIGHADREGRHVVHEKIRKMLGTDYDERVGLRLLDREAHAIEGTIERIASRRVGLILAPRDARRVTADAGKDQRHVYSSTIA
jgi:hypothetical protein